jgi:phage repressor protein C with HTH and peptisase S24 domain
MSSLGERIRHIRNDISKLNQADFAEKLGFSRVATISDYEKNKRSPDITALRKMAALGAVTLEWLLTGEGPISIYETTTAVSVKENEKAVYSEGFARVAVFDTATVGGPGKFPAGEPVDVVYVPKSSYREGTVALRLEGDGMSPNILDRATVGVDRSDKRLISGKLYAVWLDYEGVTIKRVFVYPDKVVLKPDNPTFPETAIPTGEKTEDFIIGRVKWVFQKYY